MKITKLTSSQIGMFPEFVSKWIDIGLCTKPSNRCEAEHAITEMYTIAGFKPPKKIIWCGSPLSQGITRAVILDRKVNSEGSVRNSIGASVRASVRDSVWSSVMDSVRDSVRHSVRNSVRNSVEASVGASVWDSVWDSVEASVWDWNSVWDSVRNSVEASVGASVWDSVWDSVEASVWDWNSVRDSVRDSIMDSVWDSVYGQHDAGWLSFYDYFSNLLPKETEKLRGLWNLAKSAGWALPHKNICWVCERHHILKRNSVGRLHCVNGPAVMYPDGWKIYAINGIRVPEFVVERPKEITVSLIEQEQNIEIRRILIDRFGDNPGDYLKASGAKIIDHDEQWGTLRMKKIPGDEPLVMVEVINRTPEIDGSFKHYHLRVDPQCRPLFENGQKGDPQPLTAHAAVASTFGKYVNEYHPEFES